VLAAELLRPGLLEGTSVLVAGTAEPLAALGVAVSEACTELGAHVRMCATDASEEAIVDEMVIAAVAEMGHLDLLVLDGAGLFADRGLGPCLDATWNVTRAVTNLAFLPGERGGRIVYLAPGGRGRSSEQADAACAGLENLARTLSIEWARHAITVVTVALGADTSAGEVAALTAYLASPAGAYFSGCQLDLRGSAETRDGVTSFE
jgi:NAD(P)-dependent dehydrogenase (short-subunit alcohol dehydrogenase family)